MKRHPADVDWTGREVGVCAVCWFFWPCNAAVGLPPEEPGDDE